LSVVQFLQLVEHNVARKADAHSPLAADREAANFRGAALQACDIEGDSGCYAWRPVHCLRSFEPLARA